MPKTLGKFDAWGQGHIILKHARAMCAERMSASGQHSSAGKLEMENEFYNFGGCHEKPIIESFELSPHMICLG